MKGLVTLLTLAGISTAVFLLAGLRRSSDGEPLLNVSEEVPIQVQVAKPQQREVIRIVQAPGDVEAALEVDISSEIVAKIEHMPVEEGDTVRIDDLVCRLDDKHLLAEVESGEARVARIQALIAEADAEFEKADRNMQRQIRLSESNATTVTEMSDYRTALKKAEAVLDMRRQELVEAKAFLKRVREDLKRTTIRSPIDGVVSKLNAKQGEVVVTGTMNNPGTVIMTISDLSKMQVKARVDEIDVPYVKADQKARVYLQSDQNNPVPARVVRVGSKGTKTIGRDLVNFETQLEVLSHDPRVKPGMTANVEIEVAKSEDALTVPIEAVVHRLRKDLAGQIVEEFDRRQSGIDLSERARQAQYIKVVYVMEEEQARIRLVDTGIADSRYVEMLSGVSDEDQVVIGPYRSLDQLKDGKKIALIEEEKKEGQQSEDATQTAGNSDNAQAQSG